MQKIITCGLAVLAVTAGVITLIGIGPGSPQEPSNLSHDQNSRTSTTKPSDIDEFGNRRHPGTEACEVVEVIDLARLFSNLPQPSREQSEDQEALAASMHLGGGVLTSVFPSNDEGIVLPDQPARPRIPLIVDEVEKPLPAILQPPMVGGCRTILEPLVPIIVDENSLIQQGESPVWGTQRAFARTTSHDSQHPGMGPSPMHGKGLNQTLPSAPEKPSQPTMQPRPNPIFPSIDPIPFGPASPNPY